MEDKKTRHLGIISIDKFQKLAEWKAYSAASQEFAKAKATSQQAKSRMKEALRKHAPQLKEVENIEFVVMPSGKEISVFEQLKTSRRRWEINELEFD